MYKSHLLFLGLLLITLNTFGQKDIYQAGLVESNLGISAKAKSVNNINLIIEPVIEFDKDKVGFTFPIEINIAPFTRNNFHKNIKTTLEQLYNYQQRTILIKKAIEDKEITVALVKIIEDGLLSRKELKEIFKTENPTDKEIKEVKTKETLLEFLKTKEKTRIEIFNDDFKKLLDSIYAEPNETPEFYEKRKILDERIDNLFNYFEAQLILLFKYDNEPVAGTLHYNTKIKQIQFFNSNRYETYFLNRQKNYHKLIKKLYLVRSEDITDLEDYAKQYDAFYKEQLIKEEVGKQKVLDSIKKFKIFISEYDKDLESLKADIINDNTSYLRAITIRDLNEIQNRNELYNFEMGDGDEPTNLNLRNLESEVSKNDKEKDIFIKKLIDEKTKTEAIKVVENNDKTNLEKAYLLEITNHFKNNSKEFISKYIDKPETFLESFKDLVDNFRIYNHNKRNNLILDRLLSIQNKEKTDLLDRLVTLIYTAEKKQNNLKVINDYLKLKVEFTEKFEDYNRSYQIEKLFVKEYDSEFPNNGLSTTKRKVDSFSKEKNKLKYPKSNAIYPMIAEFRPSELEKERTKSVSVHELFKDFLSSNNNIELNDIMDNFYESYQANLKESFSLNYYKTPTEKDFIESINTETINKMVKNTISSSDPILLDEYLKIAKSELKKVSDESIIKYAQEIKSILKEAPLWEFKASKVELDINDGFIEHLLVLGKITGIAYGDEELNKKVKKILQDNPDWDTNIGKELKFVNQFPYGFSSSKDFDDFKDYKIYVYNGRHKAYQMNLDLLFPNYVQTLQNDRLDYSPKDQIVTLPELNEESGKKELKKDKSSKLFNLSIYSDFNGLKEKEPNGVLQFELNKKIPLYTKRKTSNFGERYINRGFNYGHLNYVNPQLRWSRLDASNNNKNLTLSYIPVFNGSSTDSLAYVTQLDLMRYENISVGADLNILSIDLPTSKIRLELNASGRFGRTRVLDTKGEQVTSEDETSNISKTFEVNTWRVYPELIVRLRPEERYGATVTFRPIRFNTVTNDLDTDFSNISSEDEFRNTLTNNNKQWLHQVAINAHFSPSGNKDDRFFFRYRYTNNAKWEYNGFGEFQVGYSMALKF